MENTYLPDELKALVKKQLRNNPFTQAPSNKKALLKQAQELASFIDGTEKFIDHLERNKREEFKLFKPLIKRDLSDEEKRSKLNAIRAHVRGDRRYLKVASSYMDELNALQEQTEALLNVSQPGAWFEAETDEEQATLNAYKEVKQNYEGLLEIQGKADTYIQKGQDQIEPLQERLGEAIENPDPGNIFEARVHWYYIKREQQRVIEEIQDELHGDNLLEKLIATLPININSDTWWGDGAVLVLTGNMALQAKANEDTVGDVAGITMILIGAVAVLLQFKDLKERLDLAKENTKELFAQQAQEHRERLDSLNISGGLKEQLLEADT